MTPPAVKTRPPPGPDQPGKVTRMYADSKDHRQSEDREKSVLSSESFVKSAMIPLTVHRLHPSDADAKLHYRDEY